MANIFNSVFNRKVKSSYFDMSYDHKLSCNMGQLIPFHVQEMLPGDRANLGATAMVRFAPLIAPVMHRVDCYMHFFFVPNRLIWPNWEQFITGGSKGSTVPVFPNLALSATDGATIGSLSDYLGCPSAPSSSYFVSALPFAAYQKIFSDWYRDENLQVSSEFQELVDGSISGSLRSYLLTLRRRAWQHDYFTGALPWPQKGDSVEIPLGQFDDVDVVSKDLSQITNTDSLRNIGSGDPVSGDVKTDAGGVFGNGTENGYIDPGDTLKALTSDLDPTSTSITDLRRAFKLQEFLEKNARGGTRYIENILSHFGVHSSDKRLDRSEFIGGTRQAVNFSEVLQTSHTVEDSSPQANMAGHGISVGSGNIKPYFCEEHGYCFGIMSVMPKTAYFQGLPRHFSRRDKLDFYWPSFQHIGEQAILNKEIYISSADPDNEFGYVPRYSEYKYMPSRVSGDFKDTLLYWHLARKFDSDPALNADFVECNPDDRIFAVEDPSAQKLYCHVFNSVKMQRRMSKYSNPSI